MASVIDQLNFFRYPKEEFISHKEKMHLECSDKLSRIIEIINSNIKKTGNDNSHYSHSYSHSKGSNRRDKPSSGKNMPSKSWRMTKTSIIPKDISSIQKKCNEINSLLNKMTSKNYAIIKDKILVYFVEGTEKNDIIEKTISNIFMKAVMQPIYCPDYVEFLKIIANKYDKSEVINQKCIDFKQVIKITDTQDNEEKQISEKEEYDLFCKANKEKKYKEGYAQFIGEMYNKQMITLEILCENVDYFIETLEIQSQKDIKSLVVEDILICVCKILFTVKTFRNIRTLLPFVERIIKIKDIPGLQKRLQFKIMDLQDKVK